MSIKNRTVLFSSAGRRVQLIRCFREDAERIGIRLRVLAVDVDPELSAGCHSADACYKVPACTTQEFVPAMLDLCVRETVDLLVPTIDPELVVLSENRDRFASVGTRLVISSPEVVLLAASKLCTTKWLETSGIPSPRLATLNEYLERPQELRWPVIAKPDCGSASDGVVFPQNLKELRAIEDPESYVVQEKWVGKEFTVNLFFERQGRLACAIPHWRIKVRAGEVANGRTERVPVLCQIARKLGESLPGPAGPLCFQAMLAEDGSIAVFEINARFGGGYPLAHRAGARFSQWLLEEASGFRVSAGDEWREGVTMLRYDEAYFL